MKSIIICFFSIILFQSCEKSVIGAAQVTPLAVFNEAPNNSFTDLINFNGDYYCVFREGSSHISFDGKLRVVKSSDAKNWNNFALLSVTSKDLRDPHFFVDNNYSLTISTNARDISGAHQNIFFKLENDSFFESKKITVDNNYWLWSFSKWKENLYSIGYNIFQPCLNTFINSAKPKIIFFQNQDSAFTSFKNVQIQNFIANNFNCPSETSIAFTPDSTAIAIVRDEEPQNSSHIGISKFPFVNWQWQLFPYYVRGPKLTMLQDGRIFLCAASMVDYNKTYYAILNANNFSIQAIKTFPSGGDTGYPGVIIEGNTALISYYSSHEGSARVYIVRTNY
ncbi:MAG: hypothetical protein ACR2FN_13125 [Chitinophagaceae bacterium]